MHTALPVLDDAGVPLISMSAHHLKMNLMKYEGEEVPHKTQRQVGHRILLNAKKGRVAVTHRSSMTSARLTWKVKRFPYVGQKCVH